MPQPARHQQQREPGRWERAPQTGGVKPARDCPLPDAVRRRANALLHQQFWLWGQDVRHAPNLLAARGFVGQRPPEGVAGSPVYVLPGELALWGFGLLAPGFGSDGAPLYVNRFCCEPRQTAAGLDPLRVWRPQQLGALHTPGSPDDWQDALAALAGVMRWIVAYEQWVSAEAEPAYRAGCLARWPRAVCAAGEVVPRWEELAARYGRCGTV
ncbi:MAG: hypothetical protein QM692_16540 [Thermomicrobiales bacterium]